MIISKQLKESVFARISFTPEFSSSLTPCLPAMGARSRQKIGGASLANSRFFKLFGYMLFFALILPLEIWSHSEHKIYVIGDSHTRAFAGIPGCMIKHIGPVLMHRVGRDGLDIVDLNQIGVEDGSIAIYVFGEIDVRCHIARQRDLNIRTLDEIIFDLANRYIKTVLLNQSRKPNVKSIIYNVVPPLDGPMVHADSIVYGTIQERVQFTKELNAQLKFLSGLCGIGYLDVYDMYAKPDGSLRPELSDGNVHIGKEYNQGIAEKLDQLFLYLHE